MATVGFEKAIITVLDKNEKATGQQFILDGKSNQNGVVEANIQGLAPAMTKIYASNMAINVSSKGVGDVKVDLSVFNLPDDCLSAITGMQKVNGIYQIGKDNQAPYVSVEFITKDVNGNVLHFALLKGMFGAPDHDIKSNDANEQIAQDKIQGSFISRSTDGLVYGKANEGDVDFSASAWEQFVAPTTGTFEVDKLTISSAATGSGNVTVTLNGNAVNIAVASGDSTSVVASKIAAGTYAGFTANAVGAVVTFTATATGVKSAPAYSAGTTGATGTMSVQTVGA
jgi:phi13 family phage major tail protein